MKFDDFDIWNTVWTFVPRPRRYIRKLVTTLIGDTSPRLTVACNTFSLSLFKQLPEHTTDNVFCSPLSISSALAMVLLGARGNTATQIAEVLHFKDDVHLDLSKLMIDLNKSGQSYSLSLANRLYGEQSYQFVEEFLSATRKHCDAQLEPVDFMCNAEGARLNINSWVEKQTQDQIKDLLAQGVVDPMTRLVLVNAIYFKANWEKSFHENSTVDEQFRLSNTESKPVKMMYQGQTMFPLAFIPEVNCRILELPYTGRDLSMLIFLPVEMEDDTTGLEKLEKELTYETFVDWTNPDMMDQTEVDLGLPRFRMEETYNMEEVLIKMGMVDAFDVTKSDFSAMSPANGLAVTNVVHKAFVEVNEEGTEAGAATAVGISFLSARTKKIPVRFVADHPFLFFIRHKPTMTVLFAGRYCSPP